MSKINELLDALEPEKRQQFKQALDSEYIGRNIAFEDKELVNRIVGKTYGSLETKLKRHVKSIDENLFNLEEIDKLGFEKSLDLAFDKLAEKTKQYEESLKNNGKPDTELKRQLDELKNKYEAVSTDYTQTVKHKQELEQALAQKDNEFKTYQTNLFLNTKKQEAFSSVQFTDTLGAAKDFAIKGFMQDLDAKYAIEPSEDSEDGLRIVDKSTGNRVAQDNKFLSLKEVYTLEAQKANLLKLQKNDGNNPKKIIFERPNNEDKPETNKLGLRYKGKR